MIVLILIHGVAASQQLSPAEQTALLFQRNFQSNGLDIDVTINQQHTLKFTSDMFKDTEAREFEVNELKKSRPEFCRVGIWYVAVGYSKGLLSSDIMKTVSLGCAAEKEARINETQAARDQLAAQLNDDRDGLHVHADRTLLVCESESFDASASRSRFQQMILRYQHDLCESGFRQIQLKGKKQSRTVPLVCK
jgi:hypothetical protein